MSKRRELDSQLGALRDISGILHAMKNLALMERQKVSRFLAMQRRVVDSIESAAQDFFAFHPDTARSLGKGRPAWLVIGSERGFCGDYNEQLYERTIRKIGEHAGPEPLLVVIGRKLSAKFDGHPPVAASLAAPTVAEEVPNVLINLMEELRGLQARQPQNLRLEFTMLHHDPSGDGTIDVREPVKSSGRPSRRFAYPPLLNLHPFAFATHLIDQHLFSLLHEVFYSALMAENLHRYQHMDLAIQRLEREMAELFINRNALRQEEITEEIQVIMLSVEALRQQS